MNEPVIDYDGLVSATLFAAVMRTVGRQYPKKKIDVAEMELIRRACAVIEYVVTKPEGS